MEIRFINQRNSLETLSFLTFFKKKKHTHNKNNLLNVSKCRVIRLCYYAALFSYVSDSMTASGTGYEVGAIKLFKHPHPQYLIT